MSVAGTAGRYDLVEKLGAGGFGEVWRALDRDLGRHVALKFLKSDDPEELARFRREAQIAARLSHPNIAAIYEAHDNYIAMQLIDGPTLARSRLARSAADRHRLVSLLRDAALAVQYAHDHGVIHRDLKPANLMVEDSRVFVMDFGLARQIRAGASLTVSGMMIGTPAYMSPEQARGERADTRSDVYALGVPLYELLAGHAPFEAANMYDRLIKVVHEEPPPPGIDPELDTVIVQCLDKDPGRRYPTARALADDLTRWLAGEPVGARRKPTLRRVARRIGRKPAIPVAIALMAVIAAAVAALVIQGAGARSRAQALQRLASQWSSIIERKRDLRQLKLAPAGARRDLEEAVRAVDDYVREWPDDPRGYYVRARGRTYLGDLDGAERDIRTALQQQPDFRPGWSLLGMVKIEQYVDRSYLPEGTLQRRVGELSAILRDAESAFARGWRPGLEKQDAERWDLPWSQEDRVMQRLAQAARLQLVEKRDDEAERALLAAFAEYKAEEYANWLGKLARTPQERIDLQTEALRLAPGYEKACLDRGCEHQDRRDFVEAIVDYDRAINIRPGYVQAYINRGNSRKGLGDVKGAIADYDHAIELRPGFSTPFNNRGNAKWQLGDLDGAVADFDRAIALCPDTAETYLNRGSVRAAKGDPRAAIADYDHAQALGLGPLSVLLARSVARQAIGDVAGAVADCDRLIQLNPDYAEAYVNRGNAHRMLGQFAESVADFDRAIAVRKDYLNAYYGRAKTRKEMGDVRGAVADFEEALRLAPPEWTLREPVEKWLQKQRNKRE